MSACAIALALLIFLVDTLTPLDVAIAVMYVAVVLLSVTVWPRRGVVFMTGLCMVLTMVSFFVSHGDMFDGTPFARCMVSLAAIAITGFLAMRGQVAAQALLEREQALHRSQVQLAHASRVTTLGELTASIAHEVNQPLAAISAHGEACLRWINRPQPDLDEARAAVQSMLHDARRASDVIRRIRAMARKSEPQYLPLAMNDVLSETAALVQREARRHGAVISMDLDAGLPLVSGDRVQLQQVIINLLINSLQAMSDAHAPKRLLRVASMRDGDHVKVEVGDAGPGFAPADLARLFDAFFSTKSDGMGMGLPICRSIVEAHGGRIAAANRAQGGAVVSFTLPQWEAGA